MFENLSDKLDRAFKVLKGQGTITEINVAETMKEIRKALLDADVNYKTAKAFTDDVRVKAIGQNVLTAISRRGNCSPKLMNDELTELNGRQQRQSLNFPASPTIILIAGLNGAGKTTFSGKLANLPKNTERIKNPYWLAATYTALLLSNNLKVLGVHR